MRRIALVVVVAVSSAAAALAATLSLPFFLGAPAGEGVPFEAVALPQAAPRLGLLHALGIESAFTPPLQQLLEGETIVTNEKQMREVWRRLFAVPYEPALFDFGSSFVVLMGGGAIANGSFDISAVERVEASYANPGGFDGDPAAEAFLSVTATTFLSGVPPEDPPIVAWRVAAVRVPRDLLDDVVFRRNVILGM